MCAWVNGWLSLDYQEMVRGPGYLDALESIPGPLVQTIHEADSPIARNPAASSCNSAVDHWWGPAVIQWSRPSAVRMLRARSRLLRPGVCE